MPQEGPFGRTLLSSALPLYWALSNCRSVWIFLMVIFSLTLCAPWQWIAFHGKNYWNTNSSGPWYQICLWEQEKEVGCKGHLHYCHSTPTPKPGYRGPLKWWKILCLLAWLMERDQKKEKKKLKKDKSLLVKRKGKTFWRCEVGFLTYLVTKGSRGRLLLLTQMR